jgi:hypothetical protein
VATITTAGSKSEPLSKTEVNNLIEYHQEGFITAKTPSAVWPSTQNGKC